MDWKAGGFWPEVIKARVASTCISRLFSECRSLAESQ